MAKGVKTGGRKAGTPNKVTKALKDMVLGALDRVGGEEYLIEQARENPTAFLTILGKCMPKEITGSDGKPLIPTKLKIELVG